MVNIIKRENNKKDLSSIEFFQYINLSFKEFLSEIEFSDKDIIILGDFLLDIYLNFHRIFLKEH